jgi:hypothetical protein
MSGFVKILPALALAAVLSPFAATARTITGPDQSGQQYLQGNYSSQQVANAQGRAAEVNAPAGLFTIDAASRFAQVNSVPEEN